MENLHLNAPRATHIQSVHRIHFLLYDKVCSLSFARCFFFFFLFLFFPLSAFELFREGEQSFLGFSKSAAQMKKWTKATG